MAPADAQAAPVSPALVTMPTALTYGPGAWWVASRLRDLPGPEFSTLPPRYKAEIRATLDAINAAADAFLVANRKRPARVDGSAEALETERASVFSADDLISTTKAADIMGVTDSRVRQRARGGDLGARKIGGRWKVSATAVHFEMAASA